MCLYLILDQSSDLLYEAMYIGSSYLISIAAQHNYPHQAQS